MKKRLKTAKPRKKTLKDRRDVTAFDERAREQSVDFETVVRSLRRRGKI
jgi:hypothetical protein